jgi:hypothetical protein
VTAALVLDPDCRFTDLSGRCAEAGWRLVEQAAKPIVPDEPEFAVFERADERLVYTFNPVCRLRVLDCAGVTESASLPAVPAAGTDTVLDWLAAADERTVLRGILAAGQVGDPALTAPVAAHRGHPRAAIATAAARTAASLAAAPDNHDLQARAQGLAAIDVLEQQLTPLLRGLTEDPGGGLVTALRPRPGDCARAFVAEVAEAAGEAYDAFWATPPRLGRAVRGARIECHVAPAGMLGYDNSLSRRFPGGYGAIAALLQPHRVWVAWKSIEPGQDAGMAYDGLVWLDDHWAWFPKPYRVLRGLVTTRP